MSKPDKADKNKANTVPITQQYLKQILNYNPDTGVFTWLKSTSNRVKPGDVAGHKHKGSKGKTYIMIRLHGTLYRAHRLAFLYMIGEWPEHQVDHINGDGTDNKWFNLREVTNSENAKNQRLRSTNESGVIGVQWCKRDKRWRAEIRALGRNVYLGIFDTIEEATAVRKAAEKEHGFHENHGQVRPL